MKRANYTHGKLIQLTLYQFAFPTSALSASGSLGIISAPL